MSAPETDLIVSALRRGRKDEALRLIGEIGVWMPFRDPGYFDTETCFPVFSSPSLIRPFLRKLGVVDEPQSRPVKAQQVGSEFFEFASYLEEILTLNPGTEDEWRLEPTEFRSIVTSAKKRANKASQTIRTFGPHV